MTIPTDALIERRELLDWLLVEERTETKRAPAYAAMFKKTAALIEQQAAEIARLRGRLEIIADDNSWRGFSPAPTVERMRAFAGEAIAAQGATE